jgi:predicted aldo/keto reductase-like oxidoreductase
VLGHPAVSSAVLGIRTPQQLEEGLAITQALPLTEPEKDILRNAVPINVYTAHR